MKNVFCSLIVSLSLLLGFAAQATVYDSSDFHKNDTKWVQFNLMRSVDNKIPFHNQQDTYFEMEFGGRSGIFELYGYLDVFDVFDSSSDSNRHGGDNFFFKFAPRMSLDGLTGYDLFWDHSKNGMFQLSSMSAIVSYLNSLLDSEQISKFLGWEKSVRI